MPQLSFKRVVSGERVWIPLPSSAGSRCLAMADAVGLLKCCRVMTDVSKVYQNVVNTN